MRNRFPGKCHGCGEWVEADAGHCTKVARVFRVACGDCHMAGDEKWAAIKKKAAEKHGAEKAAPEGYKAITAKYAGKCGTCKGATEVGTAIFWKRGDVRHADVATCVTEIEAAKKAEEAARAAAWEAEKAAMTPEAREYEEMVEWNVGHGLCPDGCCGDVKECGEPGCRCGPLAARVNGDPGRFEPNHFDEI